MTDSPDRPSILDAVRRGRIRSANQPAQGERRQAARQRFTPPARLDEHGMALMSECLTCHALVVTTRKLLPESYPGNPTRQTIGHLHAMRLAAHHQTRHERTP